jgi:hypothetical protein
MNTHLWSTYMNRFRMCCLLVLLAVMIPGSPVHGQSKSENLIIVTVDGFRWQEVFGGMDSAVAVQKRFHRGDSLYLFQKYWSNEPMARRKALLPFLWGTVAGNGQLYGNRQRGSTVDVANPYWFSYPGYHEIFTGFPDTAVNSNSYPANPHTTILDFFQRQPGFTGRVAAFGAWEAFSRILNAPRAGFPVVAAFDDCGVGTPTEREKLINGMRRDCYRQWGNDECFDVFTYYEALEHLKTRRPRILYIGLGETDEWAHAESYRAYLDAAHIADGWLRELWDFVQNDPEYRDRTTLFITTDHGRGDRKKEQWTGHGQSVPDAHETWCAVLGPGVAARGEIAGGPAISASQFAQTFASLLGFTFVANHPIGQKIILQAR